MNLPKRTATPLRMNRSADGPRPQHVPSAMGFGKSDALLEKDPAATGDRSRSGSWEHCAISNRGVLTLAPRRYRVVEGPWTARQRLGLRQSSGALPRFDRSEVHGEESLWSATGFMVRGESIASARKVAV